MNTNTDTYYVLHGRVCDALRCAALLISNRVQARATWLMIARRSVLLATLTARLWPGLGFTIPYRGAWILGLLGILKTLRTLIFDDSPFIFHRTGEGPERFWIDYTWPD